MALMIVRAWIAALAVAIATGTSTSGCASTAASTDEVPTVVTSFYPLAFVAEWVGGPDVQVVDLTPPGVESHDLELTPRQVGDIASADLVVYQKGFQPAVDDAVEQNASGIELDITEVASLDDLTGDPHVWLDPTRFAAITQEVADALGDVAPAKADAIQGRADELVGELTALDEEFQAGLANCERQVVVTTHEAFGYLGDRYGLDFVGISGPEGDAEVSPARLREVQDVIENWNVTTVFSERLASPEVADTLAADLGTTTAILDPIEGLTKETEGEDYLTLMRTNLGALRKANGCT
ncbi:MAG TPA: metal ABC transporter substrate-binding protein [Jiangellaceae bacterium]|nr:metal ABC transporter substrate-binding protein [Jiangellaceae bacterium]